MACSSEPTTAVDGGGATTISAVHPDILQTHILTRLDGSTLASASCASSELYALSSDENLWRHICHSTWPSTDNPRLRHLISSFPKGPRSFFSDAFSLLVPRPENSQMQSQCLTPEVPEIISAVDIRYRENLIFSKVQETETVNGWFLYSPFRIDLLEPKDVVPTPIQQAGGEDICRKLAEELTLSWILIDPNGRRAVNFSSWEPVSVQRHWLSGEIQVRYATIIAGDRSSSTEFVQYGILVNLGSCEAGKLQVKEVSLQVEDMDGMYLNGQDSLGIIERAFEQGKRSGKKGNEGRVSYEEYLEMKRERKEKKMKREGRLDMMCAAFGFSIFTVIWMFVLFR